MRQSTLPTGRIAGTCLCSRCGRLTIRWADLRNDRCGSCTDGAAPSAMRRLSPEVF